MGTAHKFSCHGGAGLHRKSRMFGKRMDGKTHYLSDADFFIVLRRESGSAGRYFRGREMGGCGIKRKDHTTRSQNLFACYLMERRCEPGGEQWWKKPCGCGIKEEGNIQTQSQNFIACCLMERRRCDHRENQWRKKPMRWRIKKRNYTNPVAKISLPAVLWKEGVTTEVINGGRSPCGDEKRGIIQSQSQNFIACCLMERKCEPGGEQWRKKAMRRRKKRGIIQSQSQNFIACCLMERRCDHGENQWRKKPMRRRIKRGIIQTQSQNFFAYFLFKESRGRRRVRSIAFILGSNRNDSQIF